MNIHISQGNSKMNAIPSFSLPSGKTCSKEACKTCYMNGCYARKIERLRPNVSKSYAENYEIARKHPEYLEGYLDMYFSSPNAPKLFRMHVSGDFFSIAYFEMWLRVVKSHPHTKFLAFTKRHYIIRPYLDKLPQNLSLVYSAWPNVRVPNYIINSIPVAWMQDGCEDRIPDDATVCLGNCEACAKCWAMDGKNVVFTKH